MDTVLIVIALSFAAGYFFGKRSKLKEWKTKGQKRDERFSDLSNPEPAFMRKSTIIKVDDEKN